MHEFLRDLDRLSSGGQPVAVATVVQTRGSPPRPVGSKLLVNGAGELAGSVSGGCIEADVGAQAVPILAGAAPEVRTYGITDDEALGIGLPCGGEIDVFIERAQPVQGAVRRAMEGLEGCVVFTVLDGPQAGGKLVVTDKGIASGEDHHQLEGLAQELLRSRRTRMLERDGVRILADVFGPPPRLIVYGAVDLAEALARCAAHLGWRTTVADARRSYLTPERMPSAHELVTGWPQEAFAHMAPDESTAVVILTHDEKFDLPALQAALATDAYYVGALGSRRAQERRRARLVENGLSDEQISRISGPCGLDIGGETPAETAISIIGEILAVRAGRDGGRLQQSAGRIHVA